ncbi:type I restriction-modification system methyltransferase subunit [Mycoplasma wenyonii str. Massachusetts]|uniref:site-specific DNA-methyltransferase (adenine-specific) n=1 Tax=Mycoplasma wenyonii (strain Massachusetts) TaxID=1197325 RepID=I6Z6R8_MYCWM|nr:class I SAM-dependent DNA methyltransferase [Mycoplasma wenyonii]AFN65268.1 type I restriction-modification system methyltransferase subunit [Mycoplasma wenyonii str. Massachusetts]
MSHQRVEERFKKLRRLMEGVPIHTFDVIVNSLFLLKHLNSEFARERQKVIEEYGEIFADDKDFYSDNAQCFLEKEARWSEIINLSLLNENLAFLLDQAFHTLERNNKHVKGVLKADYFTNSNFETKNLKAVMEEISKTYEEMEKSEFLVFFQDFLNLCAKARSESESRLEKNKLHTPIVIAKLLVALADPYEGNIYDPCCGTAGLLVEATKHVRKKKSTLDNVFFYGQELSEEMNQFARINQAINGCEFKLGDSVSTFSHDCWKDKQMDCIITNFPINQKKWKNYGDSGEGVGWQKIFGVISEERDGNWAWVAHIIDKLSEEGIATFLLPEKELDNLDAKRFRKELVEKDWIEAIILLPKRSIYEDVSYIAIVVINKDKQEKVLLRGNERITYRSREEQILYIDFSNEKNVTDEIVEQIINIFNSWRKEGFIENEFCQIIDCERIKKHTSYSLSPVAYSVTEGDSIKNLQQIEWLKNESKKIEKRLIQLFECEKRWEEKFKELVEEKEKELTEVSVT